MHSPSVSRSRIRLLFNYDVTWTRGGALRHTRCIEVAAKLRLLNFLFIGSSFQVPSSFILRLLVRLVIY